MKHLKKMDTAHSKLAKFKNLAISLPPCPPRSGWSLRITLAALVALAAMSLGLPGTASAQTQTLSCPAAGGTITGTLRRPSRGGPTSLTFTVDELFTGDEILIDLWKDNPTGNANPKADVIAEPGGATVTPTSYTNQIITAASQNSSTDDFSFIVQTGNNSSKDFTVTMVDIDDGGTRDILFQVTCSEAERPDLTITKSVTSGGGPYDVDDTITYQIVAENTGNVNLTNVQVTDPGTGAVLGVCLPSNPVVSLAPSATITCSATHTVTEADVIAGSYSNTAVATSTEVPNVQNTATVNNFVQPESDLNVTKSVNIGVSGPGPYAVDDTITYAILVENTGGTTLTGVDVTDTGTEAALGPCTETLPTSLAGGGSFTCSATHVVTEADVIAGSYSNTAVATSNEVPNAQGTATVTNFVAPDFSLSLIKSVNTAISGPGPYTVDDVITYDIVAENTGNLTLKNVSVTEAGIDATLGSCLPTIPVANLAPAATIECSATHVVTEADVSAGTYSNTAVATSDEVPNAQGTAIVNNFPIPELVLTKVATQGTFDEDDMSIDYIYTVENNSQVTLTNIQVADDKIANVFCPAGGLLAGEQRQCTGTYQIQPADILLGEVTNVATASGTDPQQNTILSNQASETVTYVGPTIEDKVDEVTRKFLFRRMDRLISDGPDRARLLRKCEDRGYAGDFRASGGSGEDMNVEFGTSLSEVRAYGAGSAEHKLKATDDKGGQRYDWLTPASKKSGGGGADLPVYEEIVPFQADPECSRLDVWIEGHYTTFDSDYGDGDFGVAYVGVDYLVTDNFLVGILGQFDWMSMDEDDDNVEGWGWMVGPYISAELVNNVFFDARFAWGQSDNNTTVDISGNSFSGDFDTDRWLASARLSGNITRDDWRITPEVEVSYIEEKRKSFNVSDGMGTTSTIDGTTLSLGRLTAGPEFAYRIYAGSLIIEPQFAMRFLWDFHAEGDEVSGMPVYDDSPRGAVEVGLGLQGDNGVSARLGAKYDGIGTGGGLEAWNFNGWLNIPLN